MIDGLVLVLILLLVFYVAYSLGARRAAAKAAAATLPPLFLPEEVAAAEEKLAPWLEITERKAVGEALEFAGQLRGPADQAFQRIRETFAGENFTPLLLEGEHSGVRVTLLPSQAIESPPARPRYWLHWALLLATFMTATWAGALHVGVNLLRHPEQFAVGLPYSVALLLILGAHEMGHYLTARAYGIQVTPPYFIPVPFALGTFGAFIKIKSLSPNRGALFDVAVAGPLAGLVFAIPALLIGLRYSEIATDPLAEPFSFAGIQVGSSLLLDFLAKVSLGSGLAENQPLLLHPLAFAGWLGLIVTALNLLPIGQLDGGHIAHALFGSRKAHLIGVAALVALFALAVFVWPGLLSWAFIVFFIAGTRDAPAANDVTPISFPRQALGYLAFLILLLIIIPMPSAIYQAISEVMP